MGGKKPQLTTTKKEKKKKRRKKDTKTSTRVSPIPKLRAARLWAPSSQTAGARPPWAQARRAAGRGGFGLRDGGWLRVGLGLGLGGGAWGWLGGLLGGAWGWLGAAALKDPCRASMGVLALAELHSWTHQRKPRSRGDS